MFVECSGWEASEGRLGRPSNDNTARIPLDIPLHSVGTASSIVQLSVAGCGGMVICTKVNDKHVHSSSVWFWGKVPKYQKFYNQNSKGMSALTEKNDPLYNLRRWEEPWSEGQFNHRVGSEVDSKRTEKGHSNSSARIERKIDIVSVCLSSNCFAVVVIVWRGIGASEATKNTLSSKPAEIPRLNLSPVVTSNTTSRYESKEGSVLTPRAANPVSEFWKRWGPDESATAQHDVLTKQLVRAATKSFNDSTYQESLTRQQTLSGRISGISRSMITSHAVPKLKMTPGIFVSTIDSVPRSSTLLKGLSQSRDLSDAGNRLISRHAFLNTILQPRKQSLKSVPNETQWWSAFEGLGKSKAVVAAREAWEDLAKDVNVGNESMFEFVSDSLGRRGVDAMMLLEREEDVIDEFSILPRLNGTKWQQGSLKKVKKLVLGFENFRRLASRFWQSYLLKPEYSLAPPEKQEVKSVLDLRWLFINLRKSFLDHFGVSEGSPIFDLYKLPHLTSLSLRETNSLRTPRGLNLLRRALLIQWMKGGATYLPSKVWERKGDSSWGTSLEQLISRRVEGRDSNEDQLMRLRVEAFIEAGGNIDESQNDVPPQDWEIPANRISILNVTIPPFFPTVYLNVVAADNSVNLFVASNISSTILYRIVWRESCLPQDFKCE